MATKVDDKEPDTDNGGGGGGGWTDEIVMVGSTLSMHQLQAVRVDENGNTLDMVVLPILQGSAEKRALLAFIRDHGVRVEQGALDEARPLAEGFNESVEAHWLRSGTKVPCECCGAATRGLLASGLEPSFPWLRQPDDAGRIWLVEEDSEDPLIAVCSDPACVDEWLAWQDACGEEVGRLARRGPGGRS